MLALGLLAKAANSDRSDMRVTPSKASKTSCPSRQECQPCLRTPVSHVSGLYRVWGCPPGSSYLRRRGGKREPRRAASCPRHPSLLLPPASQGGGPPLPALRVC